MTVKFTKTGHVHVLLRHPPGHEGHGQGARQEQEDPVGQGGRQDAQATRSRVTLKIAKTLPKTTPAAGNGRRRRGRQVRRRVLRLLPAHPDGAVGTTLKFQMTAGTCEVHTATFGPGDPEKEPNSYLGQLAAAFQRPMSSRRRRLPERPAAGRSGGPDPDAARQRVLEQRRDGPRQRDAAAGVERRDVRGARHVHVLLPDPPVHERARSSPSETGGHDRGPAGCHGGGDFGRRPRRVGRRRASTGSPRCRRRPGTSSPNERDAITDMPLDPSQTVFPTVVYRRYTPHWQHAAAQRAAGSSNQDLIPGPLLRARVGDRLRVHFKNMDTLLQAPALDALPRRPLPAELGRRVRARLLGPRRRRQARPDAGPTG